MYREGKEIWLVCLLLLLKREKNVWHLQPISSLWRPLASLPVTLSVTNRGGEKYSYFACILRVEPMTFVDILKVHYEERPMVSVQAVRATERMCQLLR